MNISGLSRRRQPDLFAKDFRKLKELAVHCTRQSLQADLSFLHTYFFLFRGFNKRLESVNWGFILKCLEENEKSNILCVLDGQFVL